MSFYDQTTIILLIESAFYALLAIVTLTKGDIRERAPRALFFYVAVSSLWGLSLFFWQVDETLMLFNFNSYILTRLALYGILFMALLLFQLTRAFLRLRGGEWKWWGLGIGWLAALMLLDSKLPFLEALWRQNGGGINKANLILGVVLTGWLFFISVAVYLTFRIYFRSQQPLHKNRINYWWFVLGFVIIGDILFLAGYGVPGSVAHLLGVLIAAYAALTHNLPDMRLAARRSSRYFLVTLITTIVYLAGFVVIQSFFVDVLGYDPLLAGALVALILALFFQPLLEFVRRITNRIFFGNPRNPNEILSGYSARISNILDLDRMAAVTVSIVNEAYQIKRGILFVVHQKVNAAGKNIFHLNGIGANKAEADQTSINGTLSSNNPVTRFLRQNHRPLTQYDVDLLPEFQNTPTTEHDWLLALGMDVYFPIYAQEAWIGLLALGPKTSGDRYFNNDLAMLNAVADQTAIALQNVRLFDDLLMLNTELTAANEALNKANRQLQELDKLKSDFIGVITHELRTPFANIMFSLEILERHGKKRLPPELHDQFDQVDSGIKSAKTMVDNLVTFASFLSKQGEMNMAAVDFSQVVQESLLSLAPLAESNHITLHTELAAGLHLSQADRERLGDAVYHLIHNAIKFTNASGEVWIRGTRERKTLRFEVQDTGVGIAAEDLPALWEGFSQMADPLLRGQEGLGVGLALVKYVITAHNGEVFAESEAGVGSTFGFTIPA